MKFKSNHQKKNIQRDINAKTPRYYKWLDISPWCVSKNNIASKVTKNQLTYIFFLQNCGNLESTETGYIMNPKAIKSSISVIRKSLTQGIGDLKNIVDFQTKTPGITLQLVNSKKTKRHVRQWKMLSATKLNSFGIDKKYLKILEQLIQGSMYIAYDKNPRKLEQKNIIQYFEKEKTMRILAVLCKEEIYHSQEFQKENENHLVLEKSGKPNPTYIKIRRTFHTEKTFLRFQQEPMKEILLGLIAKVQMQSLFLCKALQEKVKS